MKKKSLGKNQIIKKKVRQSKEWQQLRIDIQAEYDNTDPITLRPLRKRLQCSSSRRKCREL